MISLYPASYKPLRKYWIDDATCSTQVLCGLPAACWNRVIRLIRQPALHVCWAGCIFMSKNHQGQVTRYRQGQVGPYSSHDFFMYSVLPLGARTLRGGSTQKGRLSLRSTPCRSLRQSQNRGALPEHRKRSQWKRLPSPWREREPANEISSLPYFTFALLQGKRTNSTSLNAKTQLLEEHISKNRLVFGFRTVISVFVLNFP